MGIKDYINQIVSESYPDDVIPYDIEKEGITKQFIKAPDKLTEVLKKVTGDDSIKVYVHIYAQIYKNSSWVLDNRSEYTWLNVRFIMKGVVYSVNFKSSVYNSVFKIEPGAGNEPWLIQPWYKRGKNYYLPYNGDEFNTSTHIVYLTNSEREQLIEERVKCKKEKYKDDTLDIANAKIKSLFKKGNKRLFDIHIDNVIKELKMFIPKNKTYEFAIFYDLRQQKTYKSKDLALLKDLKANITANTKSVIEGDITTTNITQIQDIIKNLRNSSYIQSKT